jgi:2-C-methyl-D-erythritol 4-phosphate cytidylyltransferase
MRNYHVVIPAAGQGKRMNAGKNKQFLKIDNEPLLIHTLRVFEEDLLCTEIILAVNKQEIEQIQELINEYNITKAVRIVEGGKERQQSVFEGLKAIKGNPVVLIHDGARPFIRHEVIHHLVEAAYDKGAAVTGVPVKDTIKLVEQKQITQTIDRSSLWSVQTPQAFHLEEIRYAHEMAERDGFLGTDDASLMEYLNRPVEIVQDLLFAEAIIKKRKEDEYN